MRAPARWFSRCSKAGGSPKPTRGPEVRDDISIYEQVRPIRANVHAIAEDLAPVSELLDVVEILGRQEPLDVAVEGRLLRPAFEALVVARLEELPLRSHVPEDLDAVGRQGLAETPGPRHWAVSLGVAEILGGDDERRRANRQRLLDEAKVALQLGNRSVAVEDLVGERGVTVPGTPRARVENALPEKALVGVRDLPLDRRRSRLMRPDVEDDPLEHQVRILTGALGEAPQAPDDHAAGRRRARASTRRTGAT